MQFFWGPALILLFFGVFFLVWSCVYFSLHIYCLVYLSFCPGLVSVNDKWFLAGFSNCSTMSVHWRETSNVTFKHFYYYYSLNSWHFRPIILCVRREALTTRCVKYLWKTPDVFTHDFIWDFLSPNKRHWSESPEDNRGSLSSL